MIWIVVAFGFGIFVGVIGCVLVVALASYLPEK